MSDNHAARRHDGAPGKGSKIYFPMLNNILIKKNHLYVVLEDDEGEVVIAKYRTALPVR
ncbi:MAG: hypothetical protein GY950_09320 [bacterium]|nr:hypothetical protein [bacterium]